MFYVTRQFYIDGMEGSKMDCTFKEYNTIEKAINYAHRYAKGVKFAGVQIEDQEGNIIYEITADMETINNIKE